MLLVKFRANSIKVETYMNVQYSIVQMHNLESLKNPLLSEILITESMEGCDFLSVLKLKMRWVTFVLLKTHQTI